MGATQALLAAGTTLKRGDGGSPETFTAVSECKSISPPAGKVAFVDATNLGSPGNSEEFIASLLQNGDVQLTLNFVPQDASQSPTTGFQYDRDNFIKRNYQIVYPDPLQTTMNFNAAVMEISPSVKMGDLLQLTVTLKVNGKPTFTHL